MTLATQEGATKAIRYNSLRGEEVSLSVHFIRQYFCTKATWGEAFHFIRFCQAHQLNPFLRDAYLVKYSDSEPAQMIIGYHVWLQRASMQADYRGCTQGIIVMKGGELERREGAFYLSDEEIVGGWCEVEVEGRLSSRVEVAMQEYIQRRKDGTPNRFWKEKPATMIQKVAISQAFRLAYPSLYAGMYDAAEITDGAELPLDSVTEPLPCLQDGDSDPEAVQVDQEQGQPGPSPWLPGPHSVLEEAV